ncbi:hypothetical protein F383_34709 [Gossypium arboreum]|uniref:Uncharacterized protein n=1 Tax=Gossypium arboreum TaxID=29729 RepID=A0A0B0PS14_GOSAR|nr:hypothetical protein F383_34709 [Gossypium arboreum]
MPSGLSPYIVTSTNAFGS